MIAPRLRKGDAIGIFSPSSPATATALKRYERGKNYLISKGFRLIEGSARGIFTAVDQLLSVSVNLMI